MKTTGFLSSLTCLGSVVFLVGCPGPDPEPEGALRVEVRAPAAELDPTYPDDAARFEFEMALTFEGIAQPATVRVTNVELEGVGGVVTDGLAVQFLEGTALVDAIEVPFEGRAAFAQISGLPNEAAATLCGGTVHARLLVHSTDCDCETEAVFDVEPHCFLDNRAADLLALPLRPSTDRPCEVVVPGAVVSSVQRFGYDEMGRVEIADSYVGDTFVERTVFHYGANGFLSEVLRVSPDSATVVLRRLFTYDIDGALSRVVSDGQLDESVLAPDGTPDTESTYTLGSGRWDVMTSLRNTGGSSTSMLTFDLTGRTFQAAELGEPVTTYRYEVAATDPNAFVALPTLQRVLALRLLDGSRSGETITWTWDAARVLSETVATASSTATATYGYSCL